ncbi:hypothetical protein BV898_03129 [Hypsibius exemplaris]|uniref:G-protein coupled receptors family 1 profile domain-containing protein n=1 Tax=Hypsibius exemplaris TaxID=2072580 RepID=A0A1W0X6G4_HYPEX|nr:hypothetical protein BV898_03129 [Hypsibius exemplaris]
MNFTIENGSMNATNNISSSPLHAIHVSKAAAVGWFGFSVICCFIGSTSLLLLLATSFHVKRLRTGSNLLVIHLVLIDLLNCGISFPINIITTYQALTIDGHPSHPVRLDCRHFLYMTFTLIHAETWAGLALAINRFVALTQPHHYRRLTSKVGLTLLIAIPWLAGLGLNLPTYLELVELTFIFQNAPIERCTMGGLSSGYGKILALINSFIPYGLMGVIYIVLGGTLLVKSFRLKIGNWLNGAQANEATTAARVARVRRGLLVKILIVTYLWHCLCFLPPPILLSSFPSLARRYVVFWQLWLVKTLALCGYMVTPFAFLALNADYRKGLKSLLLCRRVIRPQPPNRKPFSSPTGPL